MQPLNNSDEENRRLIMALELYRLQSVRNMLLVVLMAQLILIGIGLTLILQSHSSVPAIARFTPNRSSKILGRGAKGSGQKTPSAPLYRAPDTQPIATNLIHKNRSISGATINLFS